MSNLNKESEEKEDVFDGDPWAAAIFGGFAVYNYIHHDYGWFTFCGIISVIGIVSTVGKIIVNINMSKK
ncbi:hypothetical protein [Heyndrickxia camelliae]|uniref:Uncharacterized protein n=1 Tax=Heyndrickxia camelliae TaxID=1707093 RepID=A0A2N3LCN3_9BACI|nr:hypothetical protein [Heyndrickxia camelliae]PKR82420.1 hypothetical protein CWO92_24560 [Heyndrickxia camelliae]